MDRNVLHRLIPIIEVMIAVAYWTFLINYRMLFANPIFFAIGVILFFVVAIVCTVLEVYRRYLKKSAESINKIKIEKDILSRANLDDVNMSKKHSTENYTINNFKLDDDKDGDEKSN